VLIRGESYNLEIHGCWSVLVWCAGVMKNAGLGPLSIFQNSYLTWTNSFPGDRIFNLLIFTIIPYSFNEQRTSVQCASALLIEEHS
jgi:hypothetical protein